METQLIWNSYSEEIYFFILKKVKNRNSTNDIFQNTFLKIHENISQLRQEAKVKAWVFQIARNEMMNYFNQESKRSIQCNELVVEPVQYEVICCFDKFINDLPSPYKEVIEIVYIKGKKQKEAASILGITLMNVKVRIKRAKDILKKNFNECCKYSFNANGDLIGESNCNICEGR